jgi:uncharacterized YigZ family protein
LTPDFYYTIEKPAIAEFKDRGSKFLAYAYPVQSVEEFKTLLADLKKEHPKAAHHCFAYRLGTDKNNFRVSDDGEPSGTAGRPILGQIDSRELTNIVIIVIRYFGGTLLGVPGLINAYKSAALLALQSASIIQKPVYINYRLEFNYELMNDVMRIVKQCNCEVLKNETQLFCLVEIGIPKKHLTEVVAKIKDLHAINIKEC